MTEVKDLITNAWELAKDGNFSKALELYLGALNIIIDESPSKADAYDEFSLSEVESESENMRNLVNALNTYLEACRLDEDNKKDQANLKFQEAEKNDLVKKFWRESPPAEELNEIDLLLSQFFNKLEIINKLGEFYLESLSEGTKSDQASVLADKAIELERKGEYEKVDDLYQKAVELAPDDEEIFHNYIKFLLNFKKTTLARHFIKEFTTDHPECEYNLLLKAMLALREGKYDYILEHVQKFLDSFEDDPDAFYFLAEAYYRQGEFDKALSCADKALLLNKNYFGPLILKGKIFFRQEKYPDALKQFNKVLKRDPDHIRAKKWRERTLSEINKK